VRLIDAEGEMVGVMATDKALETADEAGLDLVEVSPNAEPPVCRVMDYGKYLFEENKKRQAAKKKQKQIQVKEVKFRPGTEEGDYQVKMRNLVRFLSDGDKAKVTLRFRGREMAHQELGMNLLKRVAADLEELARLSSFPRWKAGRWLWCYRQRKRSPDLSESYCAW
jgi:translation initiation factor IF-3